MKLKIEIAMDNAAFGESAEEATTEAARIIRAKLATVIEAAGDFLPGYRPIYLPIPTAETSLVDINGNTVGTIEVTP